MRGRNDAKLFFLTILNKIQGTRLRRERTQIHEERINIVYFRVKAMENNGIDWFCQRAT